MAPETIGSPVLWASFIAFVITMLAVDLGIFHRKAHVVSFREALSWSAVWVTCSLLFSGFIWHTFGATRGLEFLTGYVIEYSLSIDNIFVFVLVFSALRIPLLYQHRVLFWGILSALIMRAGMIFAGTALIAKFHWIIYVFGGFLIFTGIKIFINRNEEESLDDSAVLKLVRRFVPTSSKLDSEHFFTIEDGKRVATPLFLALVLVEISDVIFAVDSVPAIFAITSDPFIVFTSNIFAILGLRSLFFLLAGLVDKFRYLKVGLAVVLVFVGVKMCIVDFFKIHPAASLLIIIGTLTASIVASIRASNRESRVAEQVEAAAHREKLTEELREDLQKQK
jgi:tellurite resistance protein TerC